MDFTMQKLRSEEDGPGCAAKSLDQIQIQTFYFYNGNPLWEFYRESASIRAFEEWRELVEYIAMDQIQFLTI